MSQTLVINGKPHSVDAPDEIPLLWVLRDVLGYTGTKFGCGMGLCGACTVHVDGQPVRACQTTLAVASNKPITTIEAIGGNPIAKAVQDSWHELNVAQCGYCQAGQIMSATALLQTYATPTDEQIDSAMSGNLCRCGTYPRIRAAIKHAATTLNARGAS